jgi:hypothetical protein
MKTSCSICPTPMRAHCPALNAPICGPCCASKRNRSITCTSDCRFNPFSPTNYDTYLRINKDLTFKNIVYLKNYYTPNEVSEAIHEMLPDDEPSKHDIGIATDATSYYLSFIKIFRDGKTAADFWEQEGWTGLNSDEIAMMQFRKTTVPTLIEVQKVLNAQSMVCLDMLNPERGTFILFDRTLTKTVLRYTYFWVWLTDYPYYSRAAGDPVTVPNQIYEATYEKATSFLTEGRNEKDMWKNRKVLGEKFGEILRWIRAESHKSHQERIEGIDFSVCWASYVIKTSMQGVKKILDSKPDFGFRSNLEPDEAPWPGLAYQWFCLGESKAIENKLTSYMTYHEGDKSVIILGGIALGDQEFVLHSPSRIAFDFLKKMVEHYFKDSLKYRMESVVERAQQLAEKAGEGLPVTHKTIIEGVFPTGKAPLNDAERKVLLENYRKNYEKFINTATPMLNGMTPLAAAGDTEMRPRLVSLMKGHINNLDELRKKDQVTIDISWVLEKLGLQDLI